MLLIAQNCIFWSQHDYREYFSVIFSAITKSTLDLLSQFWPPRTKFKSKYPLISHKFFQTSRQYFFSHVPWLWNNLWPLMPKCKYKSHFWTLKKRFQPYPLFKCASFFKLITLDLWGHYVCYFDHLNFSLSSGQLSWLASDFKGF